MRWRGTAMGAMVMIVAVVGRAAAQTALPLSVDEAVARALASAPRLAEARAQQAAAEATVTSRESLARPSLTATSGFLRTNHVEAFGIPQPNGSLRILFPDLPNNYDARAALTVPIYTAGRVDALVKSAQADVRAAGADRDTQAADLVLDTVTAYWTLVMARERVHVLERARDRADAVVSDVQSRVDTGFLPPNDLLSQQAQRARQNVQLIQANNDAALAEAQLARLIGAPPDQAISPTSAVTQPMTGAADAAAEPVAALVERALAHRPERQALALREASLDAAAAAAVSALRPQVSAIAAVEPARPNARFVPRTDTWQTSWDLGINVTWSLFDAGKARADRAALTAQSDALRRRADDFDAGVAVEVRARLLDIESTRASLEASGEAVDAATEARRVVGERFSAGVATSTDLLDADVALLQAELERTQLSATLRIDEARLLRTLGGQ